MTEPGHLGATVSLTNRGGGPSGDGPTSGSTRAEEASSAHAPTRGGKPSGRLHVSLSSMVLTLRTLMDVAPKSRRFWLRPPPLGAAPNARSSPAAAPRYQRGAQPPRSSDHQYCTSSCPCATSSLCCFNGCPGSVVSTSIKRAGSLGPSRSGAAWASPERQSSTSLPPPDALASTNGLQPCSPSQTEAKSTMGEFRSHRCRAIAPSLIRKMLNLSVTYVVSPLQDIVCGLNNGLGQSTSTSSAIADSAELAGSSSGLQGPSCSLWNQNCRTAQMTMVSHSNADVASVVRTARLMPLAMRPVFSPNSSSSVGQWSAPGSA
mmetsp:Transcript_40144/g.87699  ORF Transcript_40144/g.87699 Transcript_40144/m.87699 type:complete len:319 (+) Transcript_40144:49-1005(+)